VTRSVRDTAAMLDVIGAPRPVGLTRAPAPGRPFAQEVGRDPGALRVGLLAHDPTGGAVDPECVAAVEQTARLLEGLGHSVEPSFPAGWSDAEAMLRFSSVWMTETAEGLDHWSEVVGRPITEDDVEPLTWTLAQMGRAVTGPELMLTASRALADAERDAAWWRPSPTDSGPGFDLLLTPTVAEPPVPHGTFPSTRTEPLTGFIRAGAFVPFTTQSNISGQPAISLPLHWTPDGRPVGVQLVAAFGREDVLIGVAAQLEAAAPWADRRPPLA
jgi:amidase